MVQLIAWIEQPMVGKCVEIKLIILTAKARLVLNYVVNRKVEVKAKPATKAMDQIRADAFCQLWRCYPAPGLYELLKIPHQLVGGRCATGASAGIEEPELIAFLLP